VLLRPKVPSDRADCRIHAESQSGTRYFGQCDVVLPQMAVTTQRGSVLMEKDGNVALLRGNARFRVEHVVPGASPVRIRVSVGMIEVLGTEFEVRQEHQRGWVRLLSGHIRVALNNGHRVELAPGERFDWGSPALADGANSAEPAVAPASVGQHASRSGAEHRSAPAGAGEPTVHRVADDGRSRLPNNERGVVDVVALRSQGRFDEALALVNELGSAPLDPRSHEVLSYERGSLLERLGRHEAACLHWRRHAVRFPAGRYSAAVERTLGQRCRGKVGRHSWKPRSQSGVNTDEGL
jgi:hypothetical protein